MEGDFDDWQYLVCPKFLRTINLNLVYQDVLHDMVELALEECVWIFISLHATPANL